MDENFLIERAAGGDESSFRILLERYKNKIFALCFRYLGNYEDAEDAAQETVIKIYRALPGFSHRSAFSTWVYSIAKNTCLDMIKKKKTDTESIDELDFMLGDARQDTEGDALRNDDIRRLREIINSLPRENREILILREVDGFSYEEISEVLGIPLGTVKSRLARAKTAVCERFEVE